MEQQKDKAGYIPAQYMFDSVAMYEPITFQYDLYSLAVYEYDRQVQEVTNYNNKRKEKVERLRLPSFLDLTFNTMDEMDVLIRNIFGLTSVEKERAIQSAQTVVADMRRQIENSNKRIEDLEERLQSTNVFYCMLHHHLLTISQTKLRSAYRSNEDRMGELINEQQLRVILVSKLFYNPFCRSILWNWSSKRIIDRILLLSTSLKRINYFL